MRSLPRRLPPIAAAVLASLPSAGASAFLSTPSPAASLPPPRRPAPSDRNPPPAVRVPLRPPAPALAEAPAPAPSESDPDADPGAPHPPPPPTPSKRTGSVKWFDTLRGYGFIVPDDGSGDVFVHQTAIRTEGYRSLADGERVEFRTEVDGGGRVRAEDVTGPGGTDVRGAPFRPGNDFEGY